MISLIFTQIVHNFILTHVFLHFVFSNLQAEYVVAVYQYMRLLGYPAEKITILTTYNGQKYLLRDVIAQRCSHPMFGKPHKVTTVDRYQVKPFGVVVYVYMRTHACA